MAKSEYLDLVTGASSLPHVYCKKITLLDTSEPGAFKVKLNLEIYRPAQSFAQSEIFKESTTSDLSLSQFIFFQAVMNG